MSEQSTASIPVQGTDVPRDQQPETEDGTARSSAIMAAGTLVSRVLGLVRVALLATAIGTVGAVSDLFIVANNLPNFIYLMVAGGVFNAVLVPQIIKASRRADKGSDYVSRLLTLAAVVLLVLTVLITTAAPWVIDLVTNLNSTQLALTTTFAYWCLPQIFFYGLYTIVGQVLNANGAFGPYMWAPVLNNVIAISFLLAFIGLMGAESVSPHTPENWTFNQTLLLAGGTTFGIAMQALVLFWPLRRLKLGLKPKFGWRGVGLGQTGKLGAVTIVTMLVGNGSYLVNQWVATIASSARATYQDRNPPQEIAGLANMEVGTMVYILPHSVIALSLATVMFNQLAAAYGNDDLDSIRSTLSRGLRTIGVATVFGAAVLLALAIPLGMLFSGGEEAGGALNAVVITLLAVGAPFLSANFFLNRVFYAGEDVITPLKIQFILSTIGVTLALIAGAFSPELIVPLLAVGYSVGNMIAVGINHFFLTRKIGSYGAGHVFDVHVRLTVAGMVSAAAGTGALWIFGGYRSGGFVWDSMYSALAVLAVCGILMLLVYLLMLRLLKVNELQEFLSPLLARFRRTA